METVLKKVRALIWSKEVAKEYYARAEELGDAEWMQRCENRRTHCAEQICTILDTLKALGRENDLATMLTPEEHKAVYGC